MSILNALTILGAGAARGYRASQELQRQIGEAKRKALLEEEEMGIRRDVAKAQIAADQAQLEEATFGLGEKKRQVERGKRPAGALGTRLGIPSRGDFLRMEDIGDLGSIYAPLKREELEYRFRRDNPELYGAHGRTPATPIERRMKYLTDIAGRAPTIIEANRPELYDEWLNKALGFLKQQDPEAFGDSTVAAPQGKLSDQEAYQLYLQRQKGKGKK